MKPLPIRDAAQAVGLSEYALRMGARRGTLPHIFVGGRYLFYVEMLEEYLKALAQDNQRKAAQACKTKEDI